jgi:hypothetical protein
MVILYRDPLSHAASLLEKHNDYLKQQNEDPFILEYMNWLGHHEFGENQKPFSFHNSEDSIPGDKQSIDYWLKTWINYYKYVLSISHPNTIFIKYDRYCKNPKETIKTILKLTGLSPELPDYNPFHNQRKTDYKYDTELYEEAQSIYKQLGS